MIDRSDPNPYQPPKARVEDRVHEIAPVPRPRITTIALALLWVSFTIECLLLVKLIPEMTVETVGAEHEAISWIMAMAVILITAFVGCLIVIIAKQRNWARITYLLIYLLGAVSFVLTIGEAPDESPGVVLASMSSHALQIAALLLLFVPVSNAWFRSRRIAA